MFRWLGPSRLRSLVRASVGWLVGVGIVSAAPEPRTADLRREFQVRSWNKDSGLPDDKVLSLRQTRDGYLWIGTSHGLVRSDGVAFTRFTRGTHPGMADDHCTALAEDADGHLWVATAAGLLRWDGKAFLRLGTGEGLASGAPSALLATRAGDLWTGTGNHVQRIPRGTTTPGPKLALGGSVLCLAEDPDGMIWAGGGGDRLSRLDPTSGAMQTIASPPDVKGEIFVIRYHAKSGLCVLFSDYLTGDNRFLTFDSGRWEGPSSWPFFNGDRAEFLAFDHTGAFWSPDFTNGLVRWRGGQPERFAAPWTAPEDCALCVLEDRELDLWVGTESSGLFCLTPRRMATVARADGLAHDQVRTLWPAVRGGVWAATDGGLSWIGPDLHAVTNWTDAGGDALAKLTAVAETADGAVWLGGGIGQFVGRDGRFRPRRFPPRGGPLIG